LAEVTHNLLLPGGARFFHAGFGLKTLVLTTINLTMPPDKRTHFALTALRPPHVRKIGSSSGILSRLKENSRKYRARSRS
jgi:hypothetical protein